jgi:heme exporter protein B
VLIFGAGAVEASAASIDSTAYFLIVGAIFLFSAALTPWAVAAALRVAAE